ncbi:hypothetical protein ACIQYG_13915 [Peribacillus sp. NPDC096622]|uniref:hypothetical protein n=1 Tax=Peribacillus sp. NPDC096622 TaxID=3364396 RepID=UPI0037F6D0D7
MSTIINILGFVGIIGFIVFLAIAKTIKDKSKRGVGFISEITFPDKRSGLPGLFLFLTYTAL